jgi:RND family efflux transporter MFP subunit
VILVVLAAGCEWSSEAKGGKAAPAVTRVEVVRPERHSVRRSVGEPGELQAFETTAIHAKISGYIKRWTVNIGAAVKKGQLLAELSVPEMEADVQRKEATVAQAVAKHHQASAAVKVAGAKVISTKAKLAEMQATIRRAKAEVVRWESEYKRIDQLVRESASTGSHRDETYSRLEAARAAEDEAEAKIASAEAALAESLAEQDQAHSDLGAASAAIDVAKQDTRRAEAFLGYARIEAPYDGIITQRNVDIGDLTQPGADQLPLFVIARSDIVTLCVAIPEMFAPAVNPGDPSLIELQALKGHTIEGKVTRISWALDPKVRTLRAEIDIPNPDAKLQPGLYAYATVIAEEHPDALTVPATAIVTEEGKSRCVVVVDGKAKRQPIEVGLSDGTRTEIVSGLKGNEVVAKANAGSLTDGQPVELVEPSIPTPSSGKP